MPRPVVGIYASIAPASWGPWVDRPSVLAPAAIGEAVQRAGAMAVLLAPSAEADRDELLGMLDALVVFDDAEGLDGLLAAARALKVEALVLAAANVPPTEDVARELALLLSR